MGGSGGDAGATADEVVLVDESGAVSGTAPRNGVHGLDTPLHLAFSLYVFDDLNRLLLTRRALTKRTWPGVWTNSCCGHPRPGEDQVRAVHRRTHEELGYEPENLELVLADFRYRAVDVSGVVENEICPVYVGSLDGQVAPDPDEVAEYCWVPWSDVQRLVATAPQLVSPWMTLQVPRLGAALARSPFAGARS